MSASEHVDYSPCSYEECGKENKSSVEITSKAAILLPRSLLKELIKNRGVANGAVDPLNSRGWSSCCVEGGPAVSSQPRGLDETHLGGEGSVTEMNN